MPSGGKGITRFSRLLHLQSSRRNKNTFIIALRPRRLGRISPHHNGVALIRAWYIRFAGESLFESATPSPFTGAVKNGTKSDTYINRHKVEIE